jgi:hypothetical protein
MEKSKKSKAGRPVFSPTDEQRSAVESMSAAGIPQEDIAKVLKISETTLRDRFREELDCAKTKANAMVANNLFRMATHWPPIAGATVTAAIFWAKTRARWRTTDASETDSAASGKKAVAQAEAERVAGDASGEWSGLLSVPPLEPARGKPN